MTYTEVGYNSRLDELQAAALRVQLPHAATRGASGAAPRRRAYAAAGLGDHVRLPVPADGADPAWHLYVVRHQRPDELAAALRSADVGARDVLPRARRTASRRCRPRARRGPARDRGGRADPSRAADGAGAHRGAGGRGRRRRVGSRGLRNRRIRACSYNPADAPAAAVRGLPRCTATRSRSSWSTGCWSPLAYWLAYRLRFGDRGVPRALPGALRGDVSGRSSSASLVVFTALRPVPEVGGATSGQRDYVRSCRASSSPTLLLGGYIALVKPVSQTSGVGDVGGDGPGRRDRRLLPAHARPARRRALHRPRDLRAPAARLPRAQGRARRADRRRRRRRAPRAARDPAQPGARAAPGRLRRRRPAQARPADRRRAGARRRPTRSPRILDEAEPDEVHHRDPVGARHRRAPASCARAASAASPSARCRPSSSCCRTSGRYVRQVREVQVEDVLGREPVRMELDRVGAYLTARSCSSPARAARSARSCAARSRASGRGG